MTWYISDNEVDKEAFLLLDEVARLSDKDWQYGAQSHNLIFEIFGIKK